MPIEKDLIEKTFCLFHQNTDCSCINPVTDKGFLIQRLRHEIEFNEILNRKSSDPDQNERRSNENTLYKSRLIDLIC